MKTSHPITRRGLTLVEVMIASSISVLVMLSVASGASACYQFYESMMADTELSLRGRELRDKLLFHEVAPNNGTFHTGMLDGTNVTVSSTAINMTCATIGASGARGTRSLQLKLDGSGSSRKLKEDATQTSPNWLVPGGIWVNTNWTGFVNSDDLASKNRLYVRLPLSISVRRPFGGNAVLTRTERISVPLFGKFQQTPASFDYKDPEEEDQP